MATPNEPSAPTRGVRAFVVYLYRRYPRRSAVTVGLLVVSGLAEGIGVVTLLPLLTLATDDETPTGAAKLVADVLDTIGLPNTIGVLLGAIVVGMLLKSALMWLALREAGNAAADLAADLRTELVDALMKARWRHFTEEQVGGLANAMSSEAFRASSVMVIACRLLAGVFQVIVYGLLALLVSWTVTAAALVVGAAMFVGLNGLVRATRRAGQSQTDALRSLVSRLADGLLAMKPLKAMGREEALHPLLRHDIDAVNAAQRREVAANALLPSAQEPVIVGVMGLGTWFALERFGVEFTTLLFMAFLFYRTISRMATLQYHQQSIASYESAFWSIRSAIERAEAAEEHTSGREAPALRTGIRLAGVTFAHREQPVLTALDAEIPARRLTLIAGPSGVGKTTCVDLLTGLYLPDAGEIWIDDVPLSSIDLRSWRRRVGYVPQEPVFFHDSVFVNVALGDASLTRDDVRRALEAADAGAFLDDLEDGLDTVIGERGSRLSGGQRQRLAIARAIVRRPDLLVLDEATTGLDGVTEAAVFETLRKLRDELTIVAVSHQAAMRAAADHVIELGSAPDPARPHVAKAP